MYVVIPANNAYARCIQRMGKEVRQYHKGTAAAKWIVHRGRLFRKLARMHTVDKMRDGNTLCRLCNRH